MSAINTQPVEKLDHSADGTVDFHSMFFTLQGEGPFAGHRALFIRLAGCNLQCPGCDTEYTHGRWRHPAASVVRSAETLLEQHELSFPDALVVITGGEPLRQNLDTLVFLLLEYGARVQIETNGVFGPSDAMKRHWNQCDNLVFVVSPKTSRIHPDWADYADCFKYVLKSDEIDLDDGLPTRALGHKATPRVARPPANTFTPVYVNPMDEKDVEKNALNAIAVARSAMQYGYIVGVQMHKIFNLE